MAKTQLEAILKLVDVEVNPTVFRKISQSVAGMPVGLQKTSQGLQKSNQHAKALNSTLGRTKTQLSQNERAARLFLQRMAQFAILLPTFATLNRAIQGSVKFLFEFDSALRDIVRIDIGALEDQMEAVGDAALETAQAFGVSAIEVLNVTRVFKQAGFTIEESQAKAQAAILATQISTLNSAQAVEVFIASAKQFGAEGENSIAVLDRLAKVEDVAAVNAADVAEAFRTGGNALAEFSKSIDDSIGLIAALREQTRKSGREIGTFFKTLQTRIFAAGEARSAVEALGITVENLNGTLRPTLDVLNDLSDAFDGLTEAQRTNAAKAIAGIRQFESLTATLNSLKRANELSEQSSQAAGTADEKRRITDAKLERQLQKLIAAGQGLAESLGDAGLTDILSDAITLAKSLLKIFGGIADTAGDLGLNLAPLLALGAFSLGKGIFGIAGGKGGGAGGASAPGGKDFIGPLQGATAALKPFSTQAKRSAAALKQSKVAALQQKRAGLSSATALIGLTLVASSLPKAFDFLEEKVRGVGGATGKISGNFVNIAGEGATLAAQFAFLGTEAAVTAAAFGIAKESALGLIEAFNEDQAAFADKAALSARSGRISAAESLLMGQGRLGEESADAFADAFVTNLESAEPGKSVNKQLSDTLNQASQTAGFKELGIQADELREAFFGNVRVLSGFIKEEEDRFAALAEANGKTDEFNDLTSGLADGTLNTGQAVSLLKDIVNKSSASFNEFTGRLQETVLTLDEFKKTQDIINLADNIRQLNLELNLAKLGPDALADGLVRLQQEFLLSERAAEQAGITLKEELSKAIDNLGQKTFLTGEGDTLSTLGFTAELFNSIETLDTERINKFKDIIRSLPGVTQEAAGEVLGIIERQVQAEIDLQNQRDEITAEVSRRSKITNNQAAEAALNAQAATARFSAELMRFVEAVDADVLSQVQGLSLGDVEGVLAGQSDLPAGLQQLIQSAFGDPIQKAQAQLAASSAETEAELGILARKLEDVNRRLAEAVTFEERNRLQSEQRSVQLEIERTTQQGLINATEAKIKVLEAEQDVAEEAAEAEKKRLELLEKVADAANNFANELRDVNNEFDDFLQQRASELLEEQADAQSELKEAQQGVLDATKELADAYAALVDAQFEFNNAMAEAKIKVNLIQRDIGILTGEISTFDGQLNSIGNAFNSVLNDSNISLEKRIDLERQLAEGTLAFLQQAKAEIQQAGLTIFGQSAAENQALAQGIQGLQFVADQLGGSFEALLGLSGGDFAAVSDTLLGLPLELRQQILDALNTLPSTASIGGFTVEQLQAALGQIGAGIAPEEGLPSLEELTNQQVEQMKIIQDLTLQQAQLQFAQVAKAEEAVALAEQQLDAAKILEERAVENLQEVRDNIAEETAVLEAAAAAQQELLAQVIITDDKNTLQMIEKEAQLFADQNSVFREVGDQIVQGVSAAINAKIGIIEAQGALGAATGHIPNIRNFAGGNLTPSEAAGLLRAGMREKRAMPGGAGLAVANTSEAIIPMRNKGFIPNFQDGNLSPIAAGIEAIKAVNETVVAAIARSVTTALSNIGAGEGGTNQTELLAEITGILGSVQSELEDLNTSNATVATNTQATADAAGAGTGTTTAGGAQDVNITLQTNQQNTVSITGLDNLTSEIRDAVREAATEQAEAQIEPLLQELESIIQVLRERGLLTSFGQPG